MCHNVVWFKMFFFSSCQPVCVFVLLFFSYTLYVVLVVANVFNQGKLTQIFVSLADCCCKKIVAVYNIKKRKVAWRSMLMLTAPQNCISNDAYFQSSRNVIRPSHATGALCQGKVPCNLSCWCCQKLRHSIGVVALVRLKCCQIPQVMLKRLHIF